MWSTRSDGRTPDVAPGLPAACGATRTGTIRWADTTVAPVVAEVTVATTRAPTMRPARGSKRTRAIRRAVSPAASSPTDQHTRRPDTRAPGADTIVATSGIVAHTRVAAADAVPVLDTRNITRSVVPAAMIPVGATMATVRLDTRGGA